MSTFSRPQTCIRKNRYFFIYWEWVTHLFVFKGSLALSSTGQLGSNEYLFKIQPGDFPGGPVVGTLNFQCRGHGFDSWLGSQHPTCRTEHGGEKKSSPVLDVWGIEAKRVVFFRQKIKIKLQAYVCLCADLCQVISSSAPMHLSKLWVWSSGKPLLGDHPLPPVYLASVLPSNQSEDTQWFDGCIRHWSSI